MSHTVIGKLNKPAREFQNANGTTFFVGLGEKNYDFKKGENVWTNYDAALFAKGGQVEFYRSALVEGAIISVSGTGLILDLSNTQYPKAMIQDAKLGFVDSPSQGGQQQQQRPAQQAPQQQAPQQQQAPAYQAPQQQQQQQAPQYAPQPSQAPVPQQQQQQSWGNAPQQTGGQDQMPGK